MERINLSKYSWTWGILFLELHRGRKGWMVKEGFLEELMFELIPKWEVAVYMEERNQKDRIS